MTRHASHLALFLTDNLTLISIPETSILVDFPALHCVPSIALPFPMDVYSVHYRHQSQFIVVSGNEQFADLPRKKSLCKHVDTSEEACVSWEQLEN